MGPRVKNKEKKPLLTGIMPQLKNMKPDELLRYGKYQRARYVEYERRKKKTDI